MIAKISLKNAKLGGTIPSINLPAGKTCRADAPCQKGCYAKKGTFLYKNVRESHESNLMFYLVDYKGYFESIINQLNNTDVVYKFFRWHSSGDIVDLQYFEGVVKVAIDCPQTKFLLFTKKFDIVNNYLGTHHEKLPNNLKVVFSAWDKDFKVYNPFNLPITYVNFKDKTKNADFPEFAIPCTGKCYECKACWSLEKGQSVVFNQH